MWGRDVNLLPPLLQPGDPLDPDLDTKAIRHQYHLLSTALERFRHRWLNEYIVSLREKHTNLCANHPTHHLRENQLVMVRNEQLKRLEWPLGRITRLFPDQFGVIRTVEVEVAGGCLKRPITHLVPLELECHQHDDTLSIHQEDDDRRETSSNEADEEPATSVHSASEDNSESGGDEWITPASNSHRASGSNTPSHSDAEQTGSTLHDSSSVAPGNAPTSTSAAQSHTQRGEEEVGPSAATGAIPKRRAATRQRQLMKQLIDDDLL